MKINKIVEIGLKAGEILLRSGAEIYRVEDTVERICKAYGIEAETFVLPTGIFITAYDVEKRAVTVTRRIRTRSVDMSKIDRVNDFSRDTATRTIEYADAMKLLDKIDSGGTYPYFLRLLSFGGASFCFTILFGGNIQEGIAAVFCGMIIYVVKEFLAKAKLYLVFDYFVAGVVAGFVCAIAGNIAENLSVYKILIGAIMMLLPGVAITSSIRDALHGDLVASLARLSEAILMVTAIGVGAGLVLSVGLEVIADYARIIGSFFW